MDAILAEIKQMKDQHASDFEAVIVGFRTQAEDMKTLQVAFAKYEKSNDEILGAIETLVLRALADIQDLKRMAHTHQ